MYRINLYLDFFPYLSQSLEKAQKISANSYWAGTQMQENGIICLLGKSFPYGNLDFVTSS